MSGEGWECNHGHQHDWDEVCPNRHDPKAPSGPEEQKPEAVRSASPHRIEQGPFDGQLSLYLDGVWICGLHAPLVEPALAAIEAIIEMELPRPPSVRNSDAEPEKANDFFGTDEIVNESARTNTGDSEAERAGIDDVVSAGSPSDLTTIESLKSEISTLRSTHATLQRALRQYGQHLNDCAVWKCVHCGYSESMHDLTIDLDEITCLFQGLTFTAKMNCTCGLAALNGAPGTE